MPAQDDASDDEPFGANQAAPRDAIVQAIASSGTTGRPLYYALTVRDVEVFVVAKKDSRGVQDLAAENHCENLGMMLVVMRDEASLVTLSQQLDTIRHQVLDGRQEVLDGRSR